MIKQEYQLIYRDVLKRKEIIQITNEIYPYMVVYMGMHCKFEMRLTFSPTLFKNYCLFKCSPGAVSIVQTESTFFRGDNESEEQFINRVKQKLNII